MFWLFEFENKLKELKLFDNLQKMLIKSSLDKNWLNFIFLTNNSSDFEWLYYSRHCYFIFIVGYFRNRTILWIFISLTYTHVFVIVLSSIELKINRLKKISWKQERIKIKKNNNKKNVVLIVCNYMIRTNKISWM